jgi:hypothetical protein
VFEDTYLAYDSRHAEQRLAQALRGRGAPDQAGAASILDEDVSSRDLLQLAWDRAEREIDELQTELRLLRQRHQEAERRLLARIAERRRLQQAILDSAGAPTASA